MDLALSVTGQKILGGVNVAGTDNYKNIPLTQFIGDALNVVLGVLGLAFLILVIYAGILYLVDLGHEEQVKKAKKLLANAVIGLILIVGAYGISTYVFSALQEATKGGSTTGSPTTPSASTETPVIPTPEVAPAASVPAVPSSGAGAAGGRGQTIPP